MDINLISTAEAADLLGVTPQRITQLIRNGQLDGTMIGGRWLVDRASVEARRSTTSSRGGRPRVGTARDDVAFVLMNRGHEVCQVVYNCRRRGFTHVGKLLDMDRAPLGVFGQRGVSDTVAFDMWWQGRGIPATRSGLQQILDAAGVFVPEELAMRNLGLSLSDQYWVCPEGSRLVWDDINFFNNDFERVSDVTGPYSPVSTAVGAHPDNTSDGNLSKRWVVQDGKRMLLKGGGTNNQEPYNEAVATALHRRMLKADEYVRYRLVDNAGTIMCACEDFLTDEEEFVPAIYVDRLVPEQNHLNHYQHYVKCCESLGVEDAALALWKMIVRVFGQMFPLLALNAASLAFRASSSIQIPRDSSCWLATWAGSSQGIWMASTVRQSRFLRATPCSRSGFPTSDGPSSGALPESWTFASGTDGPGIGM